MDAYYFLNFLPLPLLPVPQHADVVLSQLVGAQPLDLFIGQPPAKYSAAGIDDTNIALNLTILPLPNTKQKIFVNQNPYSMRHTISQLALVPSVSIIYHRVHYIFIFYDERKQSNIVPVIFCFNI